MPFDSFTEAMSSPAETSDKIAFAAGYVSTWIVAVAVVWGIPYLGYKKLAAGTKTGEVSKSVTSILDAPSSEAEESFDFDVSGLPDEFQTLLNARKKEHVALWNEYGIGSSVEKQAHFTQVVLSTDVMVPNDPDATLERLKPFYWLIWMGKNTELVFGLSTRDLLWGDDEDTHDSDVEIPKHFIN